MDWGPILLFTAIWACVATLVRLIAFGRSRGLQITGWVIVNVLILAAIGTTWFLIPEQAGPIGFTLWAALVLIPSLLQRRAQFLTRRQQFGQAVPFYIASACLHPFDGWPQLATLMRALKAGESGDLAAAEEILLRLQSRPNSSIQLNATVHLYRLRQQWPEFVKWVHSRNPAEGISRDVRVIPLYLRALGEIGDLNGMVSTFGDSIGLLDGRMLANARPAVRCYVFAFCGRRQAMERLLAGSLTYMPHDSQKFWTATAEFAAGNSNQARAIIEQLLTTASPYLQQVGQRRLSNPPPFAEPILTDESRQILRQAELDSEHEEHFVGRSVRQKRPWATYILILANVVMFLIEVAAGGTKNAVALVRLGAMHPQLVAAGQWWRLLSANFLHYGFPHILLNMLGLLFLGPFVERMLGLWKFLALYFASGIGSAATVFWLQRIGIIESNWLVGASGAIMGLVGATAGISLLGWIREKARIARNRLWEIVIIVGAQVVFDSMTPQVSSTAHLVGAAIGFVLSLILWRKRRLHHAN
jgi:rhomboid protease GluP